MNDKTKSIVVTITFMLMIFGMLILNLLKSPDEISKSERRKLATLPELKIENVKNASYMNAFEKYALDQFIFRDDFRKIKAFAMYNIFNQSDNNGIYIVDGMVSKYSNKIYEENVKDAAKKFNKLYNDFLTDMNVYYSIIPDKNYFIAEENGYPHIDYQKFKNLLCNNMNNNMKYIDLFNTLKKEDYYLTDTHWRQEKLNNVVNKLSKEMNFTVLSDYKENVLDDFYGVYYGQSALPIDSEKLIYLTNKTLENVKVHTLNEKTLKMEETKIYVESDYYNNDPYDIFLGGAKPLITIENENATSDKELYIFRDSYGSSLSPLLVEGYKKITIIDLRYIGTPLFKDYIKFEAGNDVLIINCIDVLNNSITLKVF